MSRFKVDSMNIMSSWEYNLPTNTECSICRENLNSNSLYYQDKGMDSSVVEGVCCHSFHYECIKPWIDKNKHCPLCMKEWVFKTNPLTNPLKK